MAKKGWSIASNLSLSINKSLINHISRKQELYLPVLIALVLLALVFASKTAFSKSIDPSNNLPIEDGYKLKLIGTNLPPEARLTKVSKNQKAEIRSSGDEDHKTSLTKNTNEGSNDELKEDVAGIVKNTPMAAMVNPISEKDRTVAAFIVGIAMKESKFGVYSPKKGGRDCYNYWGFKGGGSTVAGGYTCFGSPDEAVDAVGKRIEKMVAKGVRNPAQAVSWKCGSSCAGHDPGGVRKWIADVGVNFYKINS